VLGCVFIPKAEACMVRDYLTYLTYSTYSPVPDLPSAQITGLAERIERGR
jgi:hypothetical protein